MHAISAKDICEIIKACKNSKVKKIKFGELELELNPDQLEIPNEVQAPQNEMRFEILKSQMSEADRLAELMISDPVKYEEEIQKMDEAS